MKKENDSSILTIYYSAIGFFSSSIIIGYLYKNIHKFISFISKKKFFLNSSYRNKILFLSNEKYSNDRNKMFIKNNKLQNLCKM